jgi:hypothetical protein
MYNVLFDDSRMNNEQVHHVRPVSVALFFLRHRGLLFQSSFIQVHSSCAIRARKFGLHSSTTFV